MFISIGHAGCGGGRTANEIRMGVIHAQTGMFASFGEGGVFGIRAAVDDINKSGGISVGEQRLPIAITVVDNESDPNKTGSLAESLILQDKVDFLCSGDEPPPMHAGVSQVADRYKIPYVTSVGPVESWSSMRQGSPTKWEFTWATGLFAIDTPANPGDPRAIPGYTVVDTWMAMLDLFGGQTNKRVGLVASDEPDGRGWYTLFAPALKDQGYTVVGVEDNLGLVPLETTDFSSLIQKFNEAGVDILWGNCPGAFFGAFWRQAHSMGFEPKIVSIGRAALFFADVAAWGGDLPWGVGTEIWWDPSFQDSPGIGGTTPLSLAERWRRETGQPLNPGIGPGYRSVQVLAAAIEKAGSLESEKVNAALAQTNLATICHRVKFDENHFSRGPLAFGQWFKTDKPGGWELKVVFSKHTFVQATGRPIFPRP